MNKEEVIEEMAAAVRVGYSKDYPKNKNITSETYKEAVAALDEAIELAIDDLKKHELKYLVEAGYRKADEANKETAKEIWGEILHFCKENYTSAQNGWRLESSMRVKNITVQIFYERMKAFIKKYGVEVEE